MNVFTKFIQEYHQSVKQCWLVLIWVQTVCKGSQQTTPAGEESKAEYDWRQSSAVVVIRKRYTPVITEEWKKGQSDLNEQMCTRSKCLSENVFSLATLSVHRTYYVIYIKILTHVLNIEKKLGSTNEKVFAGL